MYLDDLSEYLLRVTGGLVSDSEASFIFVEKKYHTDVLCQTLCQLVLKLSFVVIITIILFKYLHIFYFC